MTPADVGVRSCPKADDTSGRRWREPQIAFALRTVGARGVLVTGEPGVGRTWFARAVAELSGMETHWVVATETSRSIPFGAFSALMPDDLAGLHPSTVLTALRRRLGPRSLLVVDDAHLLDEASATTLLALAPTFTRLVVTARASGPDAVLALAKDGFLDELPLMPFSRETTAGALAEGLGGEVAPRTADLLWRWSRGNGRDLTELVHHGLVHGHLTATGGVWMWRGDTDVPPVAVQPVTGLSVAGVEALCALVLAAPVPVDVLVEAASAEGFAEIEERGLVEGAAGAVRLAHPMLAAAAAPHLTPSRRRRLADRLLALGPRPHLLLDSSVTEADRFVAAAREVLLDQPKLAVQLADRALATDPGPVAALVLADAHAESGSPAEAWQAQRLAAQRVRDEDDRIAVLLARASLTIWCDRRPAAAVELLDNAAAPRRFHADLDSAAAVALLFSARPADALVRADEVLAGDPPRTAWARATLVRAAALVMADRPGAAAEAMTELTSASGVPPYYRGLARAVARLLGPDSGAPGLARLREVHAAESSGRGVFRSEVTASLVVTQALAGHVGEERPDEVAVLPGLATWVSAAVAVARREPAAGLYLVAAREAADAGSLRCMVFYLASAAEHGAAAEAVRLLGDRSFEAPDTRARAIGICARASRSRADLAGAAQAHREAGLHEEAAKFTALAEAGREQALGLTRRELEVVRHAATGLTDRAIAERLVVSVRTVESHLAAAYRKLEINSRQGLAGLFA